MQRGQQSVPKRVIIVCDSAPLLEVAESLKIDSMHIITIVESARLPVDLSEWDVLWSFHCRKILPMEVVHGIPCLNVHPGLNPYNRGMFPHVFSIMNGLPTGATIHYMSEDVDAGPIVCQKQVPVYSCDTSLDVYERILKVEFELIRLNFDFVTEELPDGQVTDNEGNINFTRDFKRICKLDLNDVGTLGKHIDMLRALTHGNNKNAFFIDEYGSSVFVRVSLDEEG